MLERIKLALRIKTDHFDQELNTLIDSAKIDLQIAGVVLPEELDAIVETAITTYCKLHFGTPDNPEGLKESYDEQKAQLSTATGYTNWEVSHV